MLFKNEFKYQFTQNNLAKKQKEKRLENKFARKSKFLPSS